MRRAGILMPISSLPSPFGIGTFSKEAYDFVDFLVQAGQYSWQILPLGPTGFGDSPYQSVSAFAGNPYFIDPVTLKEEGLLSEEELWSYDFGSDVTQADYGKLYNFRLLLLNTAFQHFEEQGGTMSDAWHDFLSEEADWLEDYALFMAIKKEQDGKSWLDWPAPLKKREAAALKQAGEELASSVNFFRFVQYEFFRQWKKLHAYAQKQGIEIIGDMPFFVSLDSCDAWSHPEVFEMSSSHTPRAVAGTADGQVWGNPVYDWKELKRDHYGWWMRRMAFAAKIYDVIRIDHFHGFLSCYAIPWPVDEKAKGAMEKGPGIAFFQELKAQLGEIPMIAEDLGSVTEENTKLLKDTGIPGMNILQYAFTSWDSIYLPHKIEKNAVVYTGNHDNMTTPSWVKTLNEGERKFTRAYIRSWNTDDNGMTWDMIREAYHCPADLCIIPLPDYLCLGEDGRINTPGTAQGNWKWRLKPDFLSKELAGSIRALAETYGRIVKQEKSNGKADDSLSV
ncbi:MAG: 4-alpha-glucanotransferase [Solobacterium sp.]|nr:4-alpha-glucanotransferase [Solobacterium sp.]